VTSQDLKAALVSLLLLLLFLGIWHVATLPAGGRRGAGRLTAEQVEYQKMMGKDVGSQKTTGFPTLAQMGATFVQAARRPLLRQRPERQGHRHPAGALAGPRRPGLPAGLLVAVPLGFVIGMSPLLQKAFDPFIQVLKPISPLAWMPLALYTIKDSSVSGVFVIFICSVWPMLINTAFGVASVKREWLNVARTLEVKPLRKAFRVILPAAAPTILTGMRISMGIAWLVIVAAEMLVGGTGIGYFVWNEWNNLSLTNVIFAILVIGVVGMLLDLAFARLQKAGDVCGVT
jgi:nitrate/nitrite transport system permease protein